MKFRSLRSSASTLALLCFRLPRSCKRKGESFWALRTREGPEKHGHCSRQQTPRCFPSLRLVKMQVVAVVEVSSQCRPAPSAQRPFPRSSRRGPEAPAYTTEDQQATGAVAEGCSVEIAAAGRRAARAQLGPAVGLKACAPHIKAHWLLTSFPPSPNPQYT